MSALAWSCAGGGGSPGLGELKQVQGLVVDVAGRNIDEVETLAIRDSDGRVWNFTAQGFVGFTPGHLREHQLFGDRVVVYFSGGRGLERRRLGGSEGCRREELAVSHVWNRRYSWEVAEP